jgi:hypothetical protein
MAGSILRKSRGDSDAPPAMASPKEVPPADSDDLITLVKLVLSHMHHNAVGAARWTAFNSGNDGAG